jgi:hypothetical protein
MKQLFATIMVTLLLPVLGFSQDAVRQAMPEINNNAVIAPHNLELLEGKSSDNEVLLNYSRIDTIYRSTFNLNFKTSKIHLEPKSGALVTVANDYNFLETGRASRIDVSFSMNKGVTWSKRNLITKMDYWFGAPTFAVLNPDGSSNPNNFKYFVMVPYVSPSSVDNRWEGVIYIQVDGPNPGDITEFEIAGPLEGAGTNYLWSTGNAFMKSYQDGASLNFAHAGKVIATADGIPGGLYGFANFNLAIGDFLASTMPNAWSGPQFRESTGGYFYNGDMYLDIDENNNLYTIVNNLFADNPNQRVPAFSKSTDDGATWSAFNKMPYSVLENFILDKGGNPFDANRSPLPGSYPYQLDGFVVTGENQLSFIYRILSWNGDEADGFIVEARFDNGTWSMNTIGEFAYQPIYLVNFSGTDTPNRDVYRLNNMGHELELARTLDGEFLVAKWIDINGDYDAVTFPSVTINIIDMEGEETPTQVTEANYTDVYMSYRRLDGNWVTPINVTKDQNIDFMTAIPSTITSITEVPLMRTEAVPKSFINPNFYRQSYPQILWDLSNDIYQYRQFSMVNLTTQSVEESNIKYNFNLFDAKPNPAENYTEIGFSIDMPGHVTIGLYDALGQKISDVYDNTLGEGYHGINYDTSNLLSGTYYIRMSVNGKSISKMLNVVR